MLMYPKTQERAQAELNAVVGRSRLPSFADYDHLPYIHAMVEEALCWRPIDPLGLPHSLTHDNWYRGYFIPAGTIIIPNTWQINRDIKMYGADAEHFNPERHLVSAKSTQTLEGHEGHAMYGFGRRVCVGRYVADNSLFIDIAMILWAMDIRRPLEVNGKPMTLDLKGCVEDGLVV